MKHIRGFITAVMLAVCVSASADSYAYLTVTSDDSSSSSFAVADISKMTFESSNLVIWKGQARLAELPLASLDKMFFSATSGIESQPLLSVKIHIEGGKLRISAPRGTRIALYGIGGQLIKEVTASAEETVLNMSGLRKGAYIVKAGDQAKKILGR